MEKLNKHLILKFLSPIIFTSLTIVVLITSLISLKTSPSFTGIEIKDYLIKFEIVLYISIILTIIGSFFYFLGAYYPKYSEKRGISLLIASLLLLIDTIAWSSTGYIEIKIEGVGQISVDFTFLLIMSIIFTLILVFKKIIDLYDFWKNKIHYEREKREIEKQKLEKNALITIKSKKDYDYYIKEAQQHGDNRLNQVIRYFINNQLSFSKKKLKKCYKKIKK